VLENEDLLLAVLNSAPVIDGVPTDALEGAEGRALALRWGGTGTARESGRLADVRRLLQAVVRGGGAGPVDELATVLEGTVQVPRVTPAGVRWELRAPDDEKLAVRAVLAWSSVAEELPGRLRACANDECNLFLVDHSRPGTAKWCSMAVCGNRMKARAHASRAAR
jgi:predicted RNA-binding Zn ribbon-like protein